MDSNTLRDVCEMTEGWIEKRNRRRTHGQDVLVSLDCKLEQTVTDQSKWKSSIWPTSVGHWAPNHNTPLNIWFPSCLTLHPHTHTLWQPLCLLPRNYTEQSQIGTIKRVFFHGKEARENPSLFVDPRGCVGVHHHSVKQCDEKDKP